MANRHLHSPNLPTAPTRTADTYKDDVKAQDWAELSLQPTFQPHDCRRRRCYSRKPYLASGKHYPHQGANCHHAGESQARCPIHGTFLQESSGDEIGKRYPAPLCYECLPPHKAGCLAITVGRWSTCSCVARLQALGRPIPAGSNRRVDIGGNLRDGTHG